MGTESKERDAVANAYSGDGWHTRVKNMSDTQIIAVYMRLRAQGKIKN